MKYIIAIVAAALIVTLSLSHRPSKTALNTTVAAPAHLLDVPTCSEVLQGKVVLDNSVFENSISQYGDLEKSIRRGQHRSKLYAHPILLTKAEYAGCQK